jgi:solute carrier family 25 folate transporter 32
MASASKIVASVSTYPYQVVRSRLQDHRGTTHYTGTIDTVRKTFAQEGLIGFYRGLVPNVVRVLPGTCITFAVYETISNFFADRVS